MYSNYSRFYVPIKSQFQYPKISWPLNSFNNSLFVSQVFGFAKEYFMAFKQPEEAGCWQCVAPKKGALRD